MQVNFNTLGEISRNVMFLYCWTLCDVLTEKNMETIFFQPNDVTNYFLIIEKFQKILVETTLAPPPVCNLSK